MDEKMHQLGSILAPTILRSRVRIPSTPSTLFQFYTVELLYQCLLLLEREKDENKQKDSGIDPFFTKNLGLFNKTSCTWYLKVSWNRVRGTEYVEDLLKRFPLKVATTKNNKQYFTDNSVRARVKEREREREREGERRDPLKICIKTFTTTYLPTSHKHAIGR